MNTNDEQSIIIEEAKIFGFNESWASTKLKELSIEDRARVYLNWKQKGKGKIKVSKKDLKEVNAYLQLIEKPHLESTIISKGRHLVNKSEFVEAKKLVNKFYDEHIKISHLKWQRKYPSLPTTKFISKTFIKKTDFEKWEKQKEEQKRIREEKIELYGNKIYTQKNPYSPIFEDLIIDGVLVSKERQVEFLKGKNTHTLEYKVYQNLKNKIPQKKRYAGFDCLQDFINKKKERLEEAKRKRDLKIKWEENKEKNNVYDNPNGKVILLKEIEQIRKSKEGEYRAKIKKVSPNLFSLMDYEKIKGRYRLADNKVEKLADILLSLDRQMVKNEPSIKTCYACDNGLTGETKFCYACARGFLGEYRYDGEPWECYCSEWYCDCETRDYQICCPLCETWEIGSQHLREVFSNNNLFWLSNLITHYRHNHRNWDNSVGYISRYHSYDNEKAKLNNQAKRQVIRKCKLLLLWNGITSEHFNKLQSTDEKTIELAKKELDDVYGI